MDVKLVVVGGDARPKEVKLKVPAILGRGRDATLALPHSLVSRRHCEITESDGQLVVRDLGSLNGTFIGSERIDEAVLPAGELLTVGTVTFRAVYGDAAKAWPNGERSVVDADTDAQPDEETVFVGAAEDAEVAVEQSAEEVEAIQEAEEIDEHAAEVAEEADFAEFLDMDDDLEAEEEQRGADDSALKAFLKGLDQ